MIQKMEIASTNTDLSPDLKKYINRKIGKLDRYMPKKVRETAHAEVKLKESKHKNKNQYTCEVVLYLPHDVITVKEATINMFAAVDIVETKLKNQIKKYKEKHSVLRGHTRRLLRKVRSRSSA